LLYIKLIGVIFISKENTTSYIILGLLAHEDMTGYSIKKKIENSIKNFWNVGYGQIYPTLKKLESENYIERTSVSDKDSKILYTINDKGKEYFLNWLKNPTATEYLKYEVILKLFFGSQISSENNTNRINDFMQDSLQKFEIADKYSQKLLEIVDDDDHFYYYLTTLFGKHIYSAYVNWAKEAAKLIKKREGQEEK
jgi:DNA-binding PadR family transcriptional regulator